MQYYPQGYPGQPMPQQGFTPPSGQPQPLREQQEVKFYKSGLFLFGSAPGRFQRDCYKMQSQGWRIAHVAFLGMNAFLQRVIVVVYER